MDSNWYLFWLWVHIVGVLGFMAAHGTATLMTFKLPKETDRARIRAWLDLSAYSRHLMEGSLLLILAGGIVNGFLGRYWDQAWIWAGLGLLLVLLAVPFPLAVPYYKKVRVAVAPEATTSEAELSTLLASKRPWVIMISETAGILLIVFFMVFKPGS
jgi:MFS family permease